MATKKTTFAMPGFSRYVFSSDGKAFNISLDNKEMATETSGIKGKYFRLTDDNGKRQCVFVRDTIAFCINAAKHKKKVPIVHRKELIAQSAKKLMSSRKADSTYPAKRLTIEDAREIRNSVLPIEDLVKKYNRSKSTLQQILNGSILPENKK